MDRKTLPVVIVGLIIAAVAAVIVFAQNNEDTATSNNETANITESGVAALAAPGLIAPQDYQTQFVEGNVEHFLLDVRTPQEFAAGHLPGAVNIPVQDLQSGRGFDAIPQDMPIVLYCRTGNRSAAALNMLGARGYEGLYDIADGINAWAAQGLPIE
jgi:phage shock protein E